MAITENDDNYPQLILIFITVNTIGTLKPLVLLAGERVEPAWKQTDAENPSAGVASTLERTGLGAIPG